MAAYIIVGALSDHAAYPRRGRLLLDDDGYYWFLYRYFQAANLDRKSELIDLYGGAQLAGYQLERLAEELQLALQDVAAMPAEWTVLVGWSGTEKSRATEIRRAVTRDGMVVLIRQLCELVAEAQRTGLNLTVSGD